MSNAAAVKQQKLQDKNKKREAQVNALIDKVLETYNTNPNEALGLCHQAFGRMRFSQALKNEIHRHYMKVSLVYAINRCASDGQPFPVKTEKQVARATS